MNNYSMKVTLVLTVIIVLGATGFLFQNKADLHALTMADIAATAERGDWRVVSQRGKYFTCELTAPLTGQTQLAPEAMKMLVACDALLAPVMSLVLLPLVLIWTFVLLLPKLAFLTRYLRLHWEGKLSLPIAFWVNGTLMNVAVMSYAVSFNQIMEDWHPQTVAIVFFVTIVLIAMLIIYPWQIIGLWRTAARYVIEEKSVGWARTVQVLIVLGAFGQLSEIQKSMPIYKEMAATIFVKSEYETYSVKYRPDTKTIVIDGGMGWGVAERVTSLLSQYPGTTSLTLNSNGGRIYEGRELSKLILNHKLNTYTEIGCYSACTTAFIAGQKRHINPTAKLGFHAYGMDTATELVKSELDKQQKNDAVLFKSQGVSEDFLLEMYNAKTDEMWYPDNDRLLASGVIHGLKALRIDVQKEQISADKAYNEIKAEAASNEGAGTTAEKMYESSTRKSHELIASAKTQVAKKTAAANIFFGYYLVNHMARHKYCADRNVDLSHYIKVFHKAHEDIYDLAISITGYAQKDIDDLYIAIKPQLVDSIKIGMEATKNEYKLSLVEVCQAYNDEAIAIISESNFSKVFPDPYRQILAK